VQARTQGPGGGAGVRSVVGLQDVAFLHGGRPLGVLGFCGVVSFF
jgi:hypothetical protein